MLTVGRSMYRTQRLSYHLNGSQKALYTQAVKGEGRDKYNGTKAVIFDMGGVILPSPLGLFREFEKRIGVPAGTITKTVISTGDNGAWARLERGELAAPEFASVFSKECSKVAGREISLIELLPTFASGKGPGGIAVHEEMIDAIKCIKAEGIKLALLTNNWKWSMDSDTHIPLDLSLFDVVVESCKVGMRKPDPEIYKLTADRLQVEPQQAIFVDDLGMNLKPAKAMGMKTVKCNTPTQAVSELEEELGIELRGFKEGTIAVPERLKIDKKKLRSYLNWALKLHAKGDDEMPIVRCYEHGQSNPTYFVRYANKDMVLRKKPPGKLLPSAHAVEREYRIMKALSYHGVPVPKMLGLCEESSLLGTPFFVMEHVPGRVFKDPLLPGFTPEERRIVYREMCAVLAKIHKVNIKAAELEDFGKQGNYVKRNFQRWAKQYEASKTEEIPEMNNLMKWLPERMPLNEKTTIVHGDFRLDNLIFHPTKLEVVAVLDWELSTLGDPITDLATNCMPYYFPEGIPSISAAFSGFGHRDIEKFGIPSQKQYLGQYTSATGDGSTFDWDVYTAFICFRFAAILQGVYKRSLQGQASSSTAQGAGLLAQGIAHIGWDIASKSNIPPNPVSSQPTASTPGNRHYSTQATSTTMSHDGVIDIPGSLPLSPSALSPKAYDLYKRAKSFIQEHVVPVEAEMIQWHSDPKTKWQIFPKMEQLKEKAKAEGLWNLFLPIESDPGCKYGAGLSNVEYAYICEETGKHPMASEIFNCSAPDTGNMEVLVRYGNEEMKEKWLKPLLNGDVRSCFGMTEPHVASSDATNIQSSIRRDGDHYIINGHKWWTSGASDPRCKMCIFMGKTDSGAAVHRQQSMIVVPMDAPGVKILRNLTVFGFDDAPHGHSEVLFENVRVPASHLLLGEGRGFEIAQGRLGPGRIHHCMRLIGNAERALSLMVDRVQNRVAFGKPLAAQGSIQQDIAKSRIEIEQARLLVLKAAHMMDTVGNKVAAPEIAMIKVAVPNMAAQVIDRAIQAHGGMGVSQDTPLAFFLAWCRVLRIADGPDEVHMRAVARMEFAKHNKAQKTAAKL